MLSTIDESHHTAKALNKRYLLDYPREAAQLLETMNSEEIKLIVKTLSFDVILAIWEYFSADFAERLFPNLTTRIQKKLLTELEPSLAIQLLQRFSVEKKEKYLAMIDKQVADELQQLLDYPFGSAGQLMDPRFTAIRPQMTIEQTQIKLRQTKPKSLQEVIVIDDFNIPVGRASLQDIVIAEPDERVEQIMRPIAAVAQDIAPREEVVEIFSQHKLGSVPVINAEGKLIGVIRETKLMTAIQEEISLDIQTMVGASKDEKALSKTGFAVVKRLPWLHINLLTAFLAASVVGIFESTIAQFTALAVLLPVVAGQSGNAGAQALAVTMRGLALREISVRHWPRVVMKEVNVGFLNGVAIAVTTGICVLVWSSSIGLALVIAIAMIISMVAAGLSGAIIPITLRRLGQDPAQSSSIILTTVTDVVGFFSFLGTASILAFML